MKAHFVSLIAIVIAASFSNIVPLQAQEVLPKGIVFYKTSSAANSDTAQAREYQSLEPAPVVVNGISLEGAEFTIQRNRLVEVITYPNLRTIRTPAEIEALKEAGRKLTNAKSAYPLAATVIEPRLAAFTEVANKLNQGMVLVGGEWKGPQDAMPEKPSTEEALSTQSGAEQRAVLINKGREVNGIVKGVFPDAVLLETSGGVFRVPLADQDEETKRRFQFDPEKASKYIEESAKRRSQFLAQQREQREQRKSSAGSASPSDTKTTNSPPAPPQTNSAARSDIDAEILALKTEIASYEVAIAEIKSQLTDGGAKSRVRNTPLDSELRKKVMGKLGLQRKLDSLQRQRMKLR